MSQVRIPAVFMRGGTSKGVFFNTAELPTEQERRDAVFLAALGSPDAFGRQLNGMGGGVSSVSKAVVVGPPSVEDADIDYTFAQVAIDSPVVDYSATCGNLSSAIGPYAVDQGLLQAASGETMVRVHNTNTSKIYHATFATKGGAFQEAGEFSIPGVSGTGSQIRLDYMDPGGATTGRLLPTGNPAETLDLGEDGTFEVTIVDASTGCVFVDAACFGLSGAETVTDMEADDDLMASIDRVRRAAAVAMGLCEEPDNAPLGNPKIGLVARPLPYATLAGETVDPSLADLSARIVSMGQVHRVLPLTGAMCLAVAARIAGSVPHSLLASDPTSDIRLANPSGVLPVDARVESDGNGWRAASVTTYRTARSLMEGHILIPR